MAACDARRAARQRPAPPSRSTAMPRSMRLDEPPLAGRVPSDRELALSCPSLRSPRPRPVASADIQRHERVNLRCLHHHVDLDLLVSRTDPTPARADFDRRYSHLVVEIGIRPDACAIGGLGLDFRTEQPAIHFLRRSNQRLDGLAFVTEQGFVDVQLVINAEPVQGLLEFILDRYRPDLRRQGDAHINAANAWAINRSVRL